MANEINIVVRTTDAASKGFRGIGQAATGMNSAIESASSALDSLDAIQQSGANKAAARAQAQNDVAQALVDQKQAELDLKQATIDANQATLDASQAKTDYNDAVKKFGKDSQEAKQAQADLTQAEYDSAQATADMKQAQVDATQAQIDLNAAQRELNPTLVQQASQKFQELAPAIGLASMAAGQMSSVMNVARIRTVAVSAATKAYAVVQRVLNMVMRANPIGLVITAITLLVGALILAYKKSDTFRAIVDKAFKAVKIAARIMWEGLRSAFSSIGGALSNIGGKFRTFYAVSKAALDRLVSFARSVPGRIRGAFSGLYGIIANPVRNAVNAVRSWLNGLLSFARGIPGRIGGAIKGAVPGFAHGGVVGQAASGGGRSGLTMVGERGPELLSLPPGSRVRSNSDSRRMTSASGGGAVGDFTITIDGTGLLEGLRKVVRVQGGNVQTVLGR
jgi:hypothetical protein